MTISFNEERAHRLNDNRMWKPEDVLRSLLRDIESGELDPDKLLVVYWCNSENENESFSAGSAMSNVSIADEFAMLKLEEQMLLERWRCG